ncbi:FecR family protein [Zobellia nedashkovskayae]|uniref:FecR family protein n=1 Tax=Zobellia nedashkovskayae TaxID=2779510 RepID=UPI00188BE31D|nr:FecR domain-containing protein [Zobellia nedashkovskayae]
MNKKSLIEKWLSDDLTEEERIAFEALEDTPFHKDIVANASKFKASGFSEMPNFKSFKKRIKAPEVPVKKLQWLNPMLKIASVLMLGLGVYYFLFMNVMTEVHTMVAEKTTIELPDSSRVVLNALSEVSYNEKNWEDKREIKLQGEAFFDVAKGAKFDVVTSKGTVTVMGTEFNVKQRGDFFEVACFEGTVRVVTDNKTEILKVGDNLKWYKGVLVTGQHTQKEPQWTKNSSAFQRIPVSEVLAELERQYDIKITLESVDVNQLFTGAFVHDNLENALMAISEPLSLEYEVIKPNTVRLSTSE